ncbi:MAG: hypothetical protein JWM12_1972, partial [Ilumatobacteraceae bacterium]|nr:hypothetical protein [Ilumatobacteraceae bacterium]
DRDDRSIDDVAVDVGATDDEVASG